MSQPTVKSILYVLGLVWAFTFFSCSETEQSLDDELRYTINTSQKSQGLSFYKLPISTDFQKIPQDPRNPLTPEKVELGKQLFHEAGFSTIGEFGSMRQTYSCASCHHAAGGFQANVVQGIGDGGIGFGISGEGRQIDLFVEKSKVDVQSLRTPSVLNVAYQSNLFWNGQFGAYGSNSGTESLWPTDGPLSINRLGYGGVETQAIAGLEIHRQKVDLESIESLGYKELFDRVFADVPESERYNHVTAGLAIAAYERTILANDAPFQRWLRGGTSWMSEEQKEGAMLFFGKGQCNNCHNGPSLAAMEFHAIGLQDFDPSEVANFDPDDPLIKGRGSFTGKAADDYKFKVPQLYNLKNSPFYGHGASYRSVRDIISYKNSAIPEKIGVPVSQLSEYFVPLHLTEREIDLLTEFVLFGLYDPDLARYEPSSVKSSMCFPNNDWKSREELGCE